MFDCANAQKFSTTVIYNIVLFKRKNCSYSILEFRTSTTRMTPFHENKLWQDAYVALMDVHEAFDPPAGGERSGDNEEITEHVLASATALAAKIADGLSRVDHRFGRQILMDAIGMVAVVRTHLAVAWGQGVIGDELFRSLDGKYDTLAIALQNYR